MNFTQELKLEPFGIVITPKHRRDVRLISPEWLDGLAEREKLVILRGFDEISREDFLRYCSSFPSRQMLQWDFGPVMEMKETPGAKNYLFSREKVPFHWDGAFHKVPSYLMFSCIEAPTPGAGGATLFCNTEKIWNEATDEEKLTLSKVELQYETRKLAHYGGTIKGPLVQSHPVTRKPILRFAESVETALNPVSLTISGIDEDKHEAFLRTMVEKVYSSSYCYRHKWQKNDIIVADNHSLIHGRTPFEKDCPRHLRRIQLL